MAISKDIVCRGVHCKYWKITGVNITYTGRLAQIFVAGFISKGAKDEGFEENVIALKNYICKSNKFPEYFGIEGSEADNPHGSNTLQVCYAYLKNEESDFENGKDC